VSERVPSKKHTLRIRATRITASDLAAFAGNAWRAYDADLQDATLRIDIESVKVHIVRSVQFQCDVRTTCGDTGGKRAIPRSEVRGMQEPKFQILWTPYLIIDSP
jgi:hypothetical protein